MKRWRRLWNRLPTASPLPQMRSLCPQVGFADRAVHLDPLGTPFRIDRDLDALVVARRQDLAGDIVDVALAVYERDGRQEGPEPVRLRTGRPAGDGVEPVSVRRQDAVDVVGVDLGPVIAVFHLVGDVSLVESAERDRRRLRANVVGDGDARLVTVVQVVDEPLDEPVFDAAKDLSGRLVDLGRMRDGDRALQDRDPLGVLIEDGIGVFRLPKRVLLEPYG